MSETSSDAESSCGWIIISNEGSDIETLGLEAAVEAELLEHPLGKEAQLLDEQASASNAQCVEEKVAESLDETLEEQTLDETLCASEPSDNDSKGKQHVALLSSSDHSDIVTLGDLKEGEHVEVKEEEEAAANEEFYLGTSCSSQYAFTAAETVLLAKPTMTKSSSSEDEAGQSPGAVVRRRRLRKNTATIVKEPEEDVLGSGRSEEEEEEEEEEEVKEHNWQQQQVEEEVESLDYRMQGRGGNMLSSCILISIVIAISIGYGHFYGTVQVQVRQKTVGKVEVNELHVVKDLIQQHIGEQAFINQIQRGRSGLDDQKKISMLTEVIKKIKKENHDLIITQEHIQAQRDDLEMLLKQKTEERTNILSQQQQLTAENQMLKTSLEREEKSLSTLQKELRNLHSEIRDREALRPGSNSLLSEVQRLKDQLEEEKQLIKSLHSQREDMVAEAQTLREKLHKERTVTGELRRELNVLRNDIPKAGKEAGSEAEELRSRLIELEKRLSFEQQRSDLWERLYVETKDDRAKGDTESKKRWTKEGVAGKVKRTFDALKNSTKEFVHHHKEQIKKAKEAVKENLKKFSDSVKSSFHHFKHSASTFINKASGFSDGRQGERNTKQQRKHDHSSHNNPNTRKSEHKVHEGQEAHKRNSRGCSGIFDCAFQESMSEKVREPIRADEFYPLLQSYVHQEADHFHHWKELESFIADFFHDGVFIHDQMLFTDFISVVGNYLTDVHQPEPRGPDGAVFTDLGDFVDRHFGEAYKQSSGPNGPFEGPDSDSKWSRSTHQQRKQQRARPRPHSERKWSRYGRNADGHTAEVKVELGPMPFDPKY